MTDNRPVHLSHETAFSICCEECREWATLEYEHKDKCDYCGLPYPVCIVEVMRERWDKAYIKHDTGGVNELQS